MKNIAFLTIPILFFFSCSSEVESSNNNRDINNKSENPTDTIDYSQVEKRVFESQIDNLLKQFQDSIIKKSDKSVLDYYYLLPTKPYFDMEIGVDNVESRQAGLKYQNIRNGYIIGGHEHGPSFTMALFKGSNQDYILANRVQSIGEMFHGFFNLLALKDSSWVSIPSEILKAGDKYREKNSESFSEDEYAIPIIPEHGTTVEFVKCDISSHPVVIEGEFLFSYSWDKEKFELK